jgi:hypothetical protein
MLKILSIFVNYIKLNVWMRQENKNHLCLFFFNITLCTISIAIIKLYLKFY